jgi:hypothetical protein
LFLRLQILSNRGAVIAVFPVQGIVSGLRLISLDTTCQRCHETLRDSDRYCPSCGLPQLTFIEPEGTVAALSSDLDESGGAGFGSSSGIAWRPALRAAALLAIPAGLLSASLSPTLTLFWVMGASAWAVSLYARRTRLGSPTAGTGARIGLITGVFAGWLAVAANGVALWITRFVNHKGPQFDSEWTGAVDQAITRNQQIIAQAGASAAQAAQMIQMSQNLRSFMLSPEGRAGFALAGVLALAAFLLLFATLGGVLGARFAVPRRPKAS